MISGKGNNYISNTNHDTNCSLHECVHKLESKEFLYPFIESMIIIYIISNVYFVISYSLNS